MVDETIGDATAAEAKLPQDRYQELKDIKMRKDKAYRLTPWQKNGDGEQYPFKATQTFLPVEDKHTMQTLEAGPGKRVATQHFSCLHRISETED